jgi:uncharacterized protein YjiS (DUF1127 family)
MREAASFIARQSFPLAEGVVASVLHQVEAAIRSFRNRRQLAALKNFDDHMLADIGLKRDDIHRALDAPFGYDFVDDLQRLTARDRHGWRG